MGLADFVDDFTDDLSNAAEPGGPADQQVIDQAVIDEVKRALHDAAAEFDSGHFKSASISVSHFGGSPEGSVLGGHHMRAHDVIAQTLKGIVDDLVMFRQNVQKAADIVTDVDVRTATDLNAKLAIVEGFDRVADNPNENAANDQGRNHRNYHNHSHPTRHGGK